MHRYCFQAHAGHLNANLWSLYHQVGCITLVGENRVQTTASSADNSPFPKDRRRLIMLASVLNLALIFFSLAVQTCLKTRPVQTASPSKTVHYYQSTLS